MAEPLNEENNMSLKAMLIKYIFCLQRIIMLFIIKHKDNTVQNQQSILK